MFDFLRGRVVELSPVHVVLNVNNVGFYLHITFPTYEFLRGKDEALLYVHMIFKEENVSLYAFFSREEREIFRHLISVSGVGPSIARMILSSVEQSQLIDAVMHQDSTILRKVKGVGQKIADRIVLELKDKFESLSAIQSTQRPLHNNFAREALLALMQLGYQKQQAEKAVMKAMDELKDLPSLNTELVLRQALKHI
ncbi:MAG: Holliday junction branch migration protein RuvA [Bacteroidales bacterium]|nr:Holliday junction branch migration protein RuvA [Bacteroidales bacterium]